MDLGILSSIKELFYFTSNFFNRDLSDFCDLSSTIISSKENKKRNNMTENYIFTLKNGACCTFFNLQGTLTLLSKDEFLETILNLSNKLNGYLKNKGHMVSIMLERDQTINNSMFQKLLRPQLQTADRLKLSTKNIIKEKADKNNPFVAHESCILVLYSFPQKQIYNSNNLSSSLGYLEDKKIVAEFGQIPRVSDILLLEHETIIKRMKDDFLKNGKNGIYLKILSCRAALNSISFSLRREKAISSKFYLWGDKIPLRSKITKPNNKYLDISNFLPPEISTQIFQEELTYEHGYIKAEDYYHSTIEVEMFPTASGSSFDLRTFDDFLESVSIEVPFRMRADLTTGGENFQKIKKLATSLIGFIGSNKDIKDSFDNLHEINKTQAVVAFKMSFATWGKTLDEIRKNTSLLKSAVQSWGCTVTSQHGDPFESFFATIAGFTLTNPNTQFIAPLADVLSMLPLNRPANIWSETSDPVLFRSKGKVYPVEFSSSLQDVWITLIIAPSGSGKSVLANSINLSRLHGAGASKLPLMTVIDIGCSSSGLIQLIKDNLPMHRKHEVEFIKLENTTKYTINPFDTHLGLRHPTSMDMMFLTNLLSLFCVEEIITEGTSILQVSSDTVNLMHKIIEILYQDKAKINANPYDVGLAIKVDEKLQEIFDYKNKIVEKNNLTWWDVVDILFDEKEYYLASVAQRYAVPVLAEASGALNSPEIEAIYGTAKISTGEDLISFIKRSLTNAIEKYKLLAGITRFELNSETRVLSIDLAKVVGQKDSQGRKQSAVMYMFARQLAIQSYNYDEMDLVKPELNIDEKYYRYHLDKINTNSQEKKITIYDECHNFKGLSMVEATLEKDAREGRKKGYETYLITQYMSDFSSNMIDSATTLLIAKGNSQGNRKILKENLKISDYILEKLDADATGPTEQGGSFLAIFNTKEGLFAQILTNTEGASALWSFSTTTTDMALRKLLSDFLGSEQAIAILANEFPNGSAVNKVKKIEGQLDRNTKENAVELLAKNIIKKYEELQ